MNEELQEVDEVALTVVCPRCTKHVVLEARYVYPSGLTRGMGNYKTEAKVSIAAWTDTYHLCWAPVPENQPGDLLVDVSGVVYTQDATSPYLLRKANRQENVTKAATSIVKIYPDPSGDGTV